MLGTVLSGRVSAARALARQTNRTPQSHKDARERQQAPVQDEKMESGVNSVKRLIFTWNLLKNSSLWRFALARTRCHSPVSGVSTPHAHVEGPGPLGGKRGQPTAGTAAAAAPTGAKGQPLAPGYPRRQRSSSSSLDVPAVAGGFWKSWARCSASCVLIQCWICKGWGL